MDADRSLWQESVTVVHSRNTRNMVDRSTDRWRKERVRDGQPLSTRTERMLISIDLWHRTTHASPKTDPSLPHQGLPQLMHCISLPSLILSLRLLIHILVWWSRSPYSKPLSDPSHTQNFIPRMEPNLWTWMFSSSET